MVSNCAGHSGAHTEHHSKLSCTFQRSFIKSNSDIRAIKTTTREGAAPEGKGGVGGKGGGGNNNKGSRPFGPPKVRQLKGKGKAKEAGDIMDGELWTTRTSTSKRLHSAQPSQAILDRPYTNLDDLDGDEELRIEFSCPYCLEEFDVSTLCSHLEDEHCFESKVATCPICATKIVKDMVGHISLQHAQSFKMQRRRRFRRAGPPSTATLSLLGKELREAHLETLIGNSSRINSLITNAPDPLLSTLVYTVPVMEAIESTSKPSPSVEETPSDPPPLTQQPKPTVDSSLSEEEREEKQKQAELRTIFLQQLVLSTLLGDE